MKPKFTFYQLWRIVNPAVLYFCIMYLVQIVGKFVLEEFVMDRYIDYIFNGSMTISEARQAWREFAANSVLVMNLISGLIAIPIMIKLMKLDERADKINGIFRKFEVINQWTFLLIIPLAFFLMLAGNEFVSLASYFMPKSWINTYSGTEEVLTSGSIYIKVASAVIVAPVIEELVFRGLIYKRIKRVSNATIACVLSALMFGVFHFNVIQGIYATILGLGLAFVMEKYDSIIAPIFLHMTANSVSMFVSELVKNVDTAGQQVVQSEPQIINTLLIMTLINTAFSVIFLLVIKKTVRVRPVVD